MYTEHFGLRGEPFSISPDPRRLYMSERHRDGLAHLLYGVHKPGGFVALTGEVGTGKTTLCRCLLEQLPAEVDVALILNPRVTVTEFLASVCDELRIPRSGEAWSVKLLVDALHRYLLDAHARKGRTVLIVDEAQQLPPSVLEQIRLLTNLETPTQKLLQIVLIGQPELSTMLNQRSLRQLNQRITARFHLTPLWHRETVAYIRHRLRIAGGDPSLFTPAAIRTVYRHSAGIPRLINVLCDRALLAGYACGAKRVTPALVRRAARDVRGTTRRPWAFWSLAWRGGLAAVGVMLLAGGILMAADRAGSGRDGPAPIASTSEAARREGGTGGAPVADSVPTETDAKAHGTKSGLLADVLAGLRQQRGDGFLRDAGAARPSGTAATSGARPGGRVAPVGQGHRE